MRFFEWPAAMASSVDSGTLKERRDSLSAAYPRSESYSETRCRGLFP
jgi:hypothetical protein